jgi:putative transposase
MLNAVEYRSWHQALQLKPPAIDIIDQIRTSPPAHRVHSGHRNVSGHYPSAKMGVTVQFETKTTQFAAILEFENDRDVLEYWDQPSAGIPLSSNARNGKPLRATSYTPSFFVLRTGSASWVECASTSSMEKRCQRYPERFEKDVAGGWHDLVAETYAKQFQFGFEIRVLKPEDGLLQRNLEFLDDYLRSPQIPEPQDQVVELGELLRRRPGVSLREVFDQQLARNVDLIYALIAKSTIYVDLRAEPLTEPDRVLLFANREAAAFHRFLTMPRSDPAGEKPTQRLPAVAVALEERLMKMSPEDMREANRRCLLIERDLRGELAGEDGICPRTLREWRRRFRNAESYFGNGFLGLLPNYSRSGNRSSRLPVETVELMDEFIKREYETLKQQSISLVYGGFLHECEQRGCLATSYATFRAAVHKRPTAEQIRKRRGPRAAYESYVPYYELEFGTPRHGDRPFHICHVDHTQLDLELISSCTAQGFGRPWLTMMLDAFSRRILSLFLTYDPPSYRSCMMVLRECVRRHERLPQMLVVDGGPEFRSLYLDTLLARYECTKMVRPPAKPRFGAVMERVFGTANTEFVYALAGNTQLTKHVRQVTKSVDPKNHALWSLADVYAYLCHWAYEHYDQTAHPALGETPRAAFERSLFETGVRTHRQIEYNQEFWILTLPSTSKGTARVIPSKGVQIYTIYYWTQAFADPAVENIDVHVRYDPYDLGTAYAFVKGRWVQCVTQHYSRLQGHSERELQIAAAEFRRQSMAHAQQFDARVKSRADFLQEVANVEAVRRQRFKDMENKGVLRAIGATQSHRDEKNICLPPPLPSTGEQFRLSQPNNDELTTFEEY